jgi:hypothetical protein
MSVLVITSTIDSDIIARECAPYVLDALSDACAVVKEKQSMLLTNNQARRFHEHLRTAGAARNCPICTKEVDLIQVAELRTLYYQSFTQPHTRRVIECVCPHCAVITTFDAAAIDV